MNSDHAGAENALTRFLATYPSSEQAPEARYWLGQVLMAQGSISLANARLAHRMRQVMSERQRASSRSMEPSSLPTATKRPSLMATALAWGFSRSTVCRRPL